MHVKLIRKIIRLENVAENQNTSTRNELDDI